MGGSPLLKNYSSGDGGPPWKILTYFINMVKIPYTGHRPTPTRLRPPPPPGQTNKTTLLTPLEKQFWICKWWPADTFEGILFKKIDYTNVINSMTYMYIPVIYLQHISYAGFPSYVQSLSSAPTQKKDE